jgi:hypothetical protein
MKCDPQSPPPIPARLLTTWLEDNARFIEEDIARRNEVLREVRSQRNDLLNQIRRAELTHPVPLGAVDAAIAVEPLGDMLMILDT